MFELDSERREFKGVLCHRGEDGGPQRDLRREEVRWHAEGDLRADLRAEELGSHEC